MKILTPISCGEVERGHQQPSIEFALKVSRLFNVTMDQLTKDELEVDVENEHDIQDVMAE